MSADKSSDGSTEALSRLSRWFSIRRGSNTNYDLMSPSQTPLNSNRHSFLDQTCEGINLFESKEPSIEDVEVIIENNIV